MIAKKNSLVAVAFFLCLLNTYSQKKEQFIYEYSISVNDKHHSEGFSWFDSIYYYSTVNYNSFYSHWISADSVYGPKKSYSTFWDYVGYESVSLFLLRKEGKYVRDLVTNRNLFPLEKEITIKGYWFQFPDGKSSDSVFTELTNNKDVLIIDGKKIQCYVFKMYEKDFRQEWHNREPRREERLYYISKKGLLPIKVVHKIFYEKSSTYSTEIVLSKTIKISKEILPVKIIPPVK